MLCQTGIFPFEVRVAERSVEGRHARIHQIQKRAPRAGIPYISHELRFPNLKALASSNPLALRELTARLSGIETAQGLRRAVMSLVLAFVISLCYPTWR